VHAVSHNLDFSGRRFVDLLAAAGERLFSRDDGIAELRAGTDPAGASRG
jgi:hypothetical protein